jgi:hypothetical protein
MFGQREVEGSYRIGMAVLGLKVEVAAGLVVGRGMGRWSGAFATVDQLPYSTHIIVRKTARRMTYHECLTVLDTMTIPIRPRRRFLTPRRRVASIPILPSLLLLCKLLHHQVPPTPPLPLVQITAFQLPFLAVLNLSALLPLLQETEGDSLHKGQ